MLALLLVSDAMEHSKGSKKVYFINSDVMKLLHEAEQNKNDLSGTL